MRMTQLAELCDSHSSEKCARVSFVRFLRFNLAIRYSCLPTSSRLAKKQNADSEHPGSRTSSCWLRSSTCPPVHMIFIPLPAFSITFRAMGCGQALRLPKRPRKRRRKNMSMTSLIRRTLGHSCLVAALKLPSAEKQAFRGCP